MQSHPQIQSPGHKGRLGISPRLHTQMDLTDPFEDLPMDSQSRESEEASLETIDLQLSTDSAKPFQAAFQKNKAIWQLYFHEVEEGLQSW